MNQVMLRTDALGKSFTLHLQGGVRIPVLANVGLQVHAGECIVLSGPSGVGKSTLMRSLYGNYRAESGCILIRHRGTIVDLARADPRTVLAIRHETLGYVSQFLRVVPRVPALDVVAEVPIGRGAVNRSVVVSMINEAKQRGTAIIAICHDAEVRDAIADRLFQLTPLQDAA